MLATYPTHCQGVLVLLEERVPAVFARMSKMGRQKKELQNWGYGCISEQCFKKPVAMARIIDVNSNKKGLVRSVLLNMGEWSGNEN